MIHGLDNLAPPDVAWVLRGRLALPSPPAALVPPQRQCSPVPPPRRLVVFRRPGPSAILHARVQAPVARLLRYPCGAFPAKLRPRHSRLCYSSAHQCHSLPLRSRAKQGLRVNSHSVSLRCHRHAPLGIAGPFRRVLRCALLPPCAVARGYAIA